MVPSPLSMSQDSFHSSMVTPLMWLLSSCQGFPKGSTLASSMNPLQHPCVRTNLPSNADAVSAAILKELHRGHTAGPFDAPTLPKMHCSPLGAAPKKDGSMRIILDLSFPKGHSVNDGIPIESCQVRYNSFDDALGMINATGKDCFMTKIDIKHAFRLCPVREED